MSIKVMTWVWEHDFPPHLQSLMLALADHGDDDGQHIYPSVRHLVWKTGSSERAIRVNLKRLRSDKVLIPVRQASQHRPTEYRISLSQTTYPAKKPWAEVCDEFRGAGVAPLGNAEVQPSVSQGCSPEYPEVQPTAPESLESSLESNKKILSLSTFNPSHPDEIEISYGLLAELVSKELLRGAPMALLVLHKRYGPKTVQAMIRTRANEIRGAYSPVQKLEELLRSLQAVKQHG